MAATYSDQQKRWARNLQDTYMKEVREAWREEEEAAKRRVRKVNEAERKRNSALHLLGIKVNDLGSITS